MEDVGRFAEGVWYYCFALGGSVTSWIRTPKRNKAVGGRARSLHLSGLAVDVVYDTVPSVEAAREVARSHGLRILREKDHDHLTPA